jgi:hypothetical protein
MFGEISTSYRGLSDTQRAALAELFALRNEYYAQATKLNNIRLRVLQDPTPGGEDEVREFAAVMVTPVRMRMVEATGKLLTEEALDLERLKGMLPMVLMALTQSVNVSLLMNLLDVEPDIVEKMLEQVREYFSSGMQ